VGLFGDDKGGGVSITLRNKENIISEPKNIFWNIKNEEYRDIIHSIYDWNEK